MVERSRAADDFDVIRERIEQLRREREEAAATTPPAETPGDTDEAERRERCEGAPPSWVPTIFLPQSMV